MQTLFLFSDLLTFKIYSWVRANIASLHQICFNLLFYTMRPILLWNMNTKFEGLWKCLIYTGNLKILLCFMFIKLTLKIYSYTVLTVLVCMDEVLLQNIKTKSIYFKQRIRCSKSTYFKQRIRCSKSTYFKKRIRCSKSTYIFIPYYL